MDKRLSLQLNGNRKVTGVLRGFDPFMNIVLDETVEEISATEKHNIGMVVISLIHIYLMYSISNSILS
jgi:small nuclear ribonucleoprotein G